VRHLGQGHVLPFHALPFDVPKFLVYESVRGRDEKTERGGREIVCESVIGR
jgi:hypothetical protein